MLCDFQKTFNPTITERLKQLLKLKSICKDTKNDCSNCIHMIPPDIHVPEWAGDYGNCSIHPELFPNKDCPYWEYNNLDKFFDKKIQELCSSHKFYIGEQVFVKTKITKDQSNWFNSKDYQGIASIMGSVITISGVKLYKNTFIYSVFENNYEWLEDMLENI